MTGIILENITTINDLSMFSKAYKEGLIKVNISKIAKELNKDRKTIRKYLEGYTPKETRDRIKYLEKSIKPYEKDIIIIGGTEFNLGQEVLNFENIKNEHN